jgi:magnesium transporter
MTIKTNSVINVLTIFSVIIGALTLISGIYGMNVTLPGAANSHFFLVIMGIMGGAAIALLIFFSKKKRI